jgi:hypothetical protein
MALPTLNTPTFKIPVYSKNNKEYDFRPFLVKEEKILLMAQESGNSSEMMQAMQMAVTSCSNEKLDGEKLPFFDLQNIFINLRIKSIGETSDFELVCGECSAHTPIKMDLKELKLKFTEGHSNKIELTPEVGVIMNYPTSKILTDTTTPAFDLVVDCVDKIYNGDEVYEAKEEGRQEVSNFIESLTTEQFNSIIRFFETTPRIEKVVEYTCAKCNTENVVLIDGIENFFE